VGLVRLADQRANVGRNWSESCRSRRRLVRHTDQRAEEADRPAESSAPDRRLVRLADQGPRSRFRRTDSGKTHPRSPGRVSGLTVRPAAESSMSVPSRFARVSGLFAVTIQ
jgi:hypothetical protein